MASDCLQTIANRSVEGQQKRGGWNLGVIALLVAFGYYFGARLGLALTLPPRPVSVLWPPNAILLAALLLTAPRLWWLLLVSAFPAHCAAQWQSGVPFPMIICWFLSNCCEAFISATCIRYLARETIRFDSVRAVAAFCLGGVLIGPLLSSFLDAGFVRLNQWGEGTYWYIWRIRFTSNMLAALTIVPAMVTWWNLLLKSPPLPSLQKLAEAGLVSAGVLVTSWTVYVFYDANAKVNTTLLYAELPFLLWAAVRFASLGASTAMLVTAFLAIWGAAHGHGPFSTRSPEESARSVQLFLTLAAVPILMLGAAVEERGQAEERFRKAFVLCPDPMLICRRSNGYVVDANNRCQEMLGYDAGQTNGQPIFDLPIFASDQDRERLRKAICEKPPFRELDLCLRGARGDTCQTLVSADVAEISGEDCIIVVIRDVTDRKRAEEAMQNLAHTSRLAIMGELTAMIAHEVNQPLGAILSNADAADIILETDPHRIAEVRRILADIRADDTRASEAICRIRALLRRKEMQMQVVDLNDTAEDVLKLVKGDAIRQRVQLRSELDPALRPILGDKVHLQQVLLNLLINGMDAMQDIPISQRVLTVLTRVKKDHAELAVQDSGHGITSENSSRLFDSFFTTKKEGMGLGLAIARSIIEAHRGSILAENSPEGGAIFRVYFPFLPANTTDP
jgi:PAS domain S-box-containing protein